MDRMMGCKLRQPIILSIDRLGAKKIGHLADKI